MKKLFHITNLNAALNIIESKIFIPHPPYPSNFIIKNYDNCLNCFITKSLAKTSNQCFQNKGLILVFKWNGPHKQQNNNLEWPYPKNILYIDEPWRCIIPAGSEQYLTLSNIYFDKKYLERIIENSSSTYLKILPYKIKQKVIKQKKLDFLNYIRNLLKINRNVNIKIK